MRSFKYCIHSEGAQSIFLVFTVYKFSLGRYVLLVDEKIP